MWHHKSISFLISIVCIMAIGILVACTSQSAQQSIYDPSKNYAAVLVLNNPNSAKVVDNIKSTTLASGYEIGPIEYYNAGTTDFEPILKKLTPSKQITVLWVAASLLDVPNIQKAIAIVSFKGQVRYMPIVGPLGQ